MLKILVIGAVATTEYTLKSLLKHQFNVVGVLGHEPINIEKISGWVNLKKLSNENKLSYKGFKKINELENIEWASQKKPDIIFAIGFSQLMSDHWLNMPKLGCIGFHPTKLPEGRGRAPLAWIILEKKHGSATFFLMGKGADNGPIFVQNIFVVEENDNAIIVEKKIEQAVEKSLDEWLPKLKEGIWEPIPQDEAKASWYGKRAIEDGVIDWNKSNFLIDRLIKASSRPHPGAYTYYKDSKIIIWSSEIEYNIPIKGVVGRILISDRNKGNLIQCGEGLIWIKDIEMSESIILETGVKLGYNIEDELFKIKNILKKITNE